MGSAPFVEVYVVPICRLKTMESVPEEEFVVSIHWHCRQTCRNWVAGSNSHLQTSCIRMEIALCGLPRLVSFCSESDQGKKACRARGDAPDGTASWQQVGGTGQREPARWGVDHSSAGSGARTKARTERVPSVTMISTLALTSGAAHQVDGRNITSSGPCLLGARRFGDLQAFREVRIPQLGHLVAVAVDNPPERHAELVLVARDLDAVFDIRHFFAERADAVNPRAARFMNAASSGPNRSSRALAKPPRSLVLIAVPATMNELPNAPLCAVLL
jgi:hypothetical protein